MAHPCATRVPDQTWIRSMSTTDIDRPPKKRRRRRRKDHSADPKQAAPKLQVKP